MTNSQPKSVGIYARVSTPDGRQETENQLVQLHSYCDKQGWTIVGEYVDRKSGATAERPPVQATVPPRPSATIRHGHVLVARQVLQGRDARDAQASGEVELLRGRLEELHGGVRGLVRVIPGGDHRDSRCNCQTGTSATVGEGQSRNRAVATTRADRSPGASPTHRGPGGVEAGSR